MTTGNYPSLLKKSCIGLGTSYLTIQNLQTSVRRQIKTIILPMGLFKREADKCFSCTYKTILKNLWWSLIPFVLLL
jgi:hypothetical protein